MSKRAMMIFATVVLLAVPLPAGAHSVEEIEEWEADWDARLREMIDSTSEADLGLTTDLLWPLILDRAEWEKRHDWYYNPQPARATTLDNGSTGSGSGSGMGTGVEQWRPLVAAYFGGETDLALCVMAGESGGNPNAKNPNSSARGLFQILGSLWAPYFGIAMDDLYDPETNVSIAKQIRDQSGWGAWNQYWGCV